MFFEDYEMNVLDEDEDLEAYFSEDNSYVEEDGSGLTQITLESEMSWANIEKSCIMEEFNAIKNESTVLMEESKENFFKKAIEWIKEKATKIINFFKSLFATLQAKATNVDKFMTKYEKDLGKNPDAKGFIHKWTKGLSLKDFVGDINKGQSFDNHTNLMSLDQLSMYMCNMSYKDYRKNKKLEYRSDEKKEGTLKIESVKNTLKNYKTWIKELNQAKDASLKVLKKGEQVAKEAINKKDDESKKIGKIKITNCKNTSTVVDTIASTGISLMNELVTDALIIARASLKEKKTKAKDESYSFFDLI